MLNKDIIKVKKKNYITRTYDPFIFKKKEVIDNINLCYDINLIDTKKFFLKEDHWVCTYQEKENLTELYYNNGYLPEQFLRYEKIYEIPNKIQYKQTFRNIKSIPSIDFLQDVFDSIFPNASFRDYYFDPKIVEMSDLSLNCDPFSFNPNYKTYAKDNFDKLTPILKTHLPPTRANCFTETHLAAIKRNLNIPQLQSLTSDNETSRIMVKRFISAYIPKNNRGILSEFFERKIEPNLNLAYLWIDSQKAKVDRSIDPNFDLYSDDMDYYSYIIKSTPKPVLDISGINTYSALQTIAYHDKNINAIFCSIFKTIKERLMMIIHPKFKLFTDMSADDFAERLSEEFDAEILDSTYKMEVDLSKYDKSQGKIFLDAEIEIYRILGVPEHFLILWYNAHKYTTLNDRVNKLRYFVKYQRKSGDASTYLGNTIVLMIVLACLFDMKDMELGLFSGDDSLLLSKKPFPDRNFECANLFNLESKFFKYKYSYFCSKFLLNINGVFRFIPDPIKILVKFGRSDLVNYDHVNEYRISCCDLLKVYNDTNIDEKLNCALQERYKTKFYDNTYLIENILILINNKEFFNKLFYIHHGANICLDPSRPNLD